MIQFTDSQQSAIIAFKTFLQSQEQVFMLKGAAGTGKTTLAIEFINILKKTDRPFRLMAPTGRAAYIIGIKTGNQAYTIHKSIYELSCLESKSNEKEEENDDCLHARFGLKSNDDSQNTIYIVDESSMVSNAFSENDAFSFGSGKLLSDLFEFAGNRKLVFIGDYAQLPPVGMNFSPALDKEYIENSYSCKVSEYMLREVVRQSADSVTLYNATKIRDSIEAKTFIEFKLTEGIDSTAENTNLLNPYFKLSETNPDIRSAIITYSNKQALEYNLAVRRHYYGNDVSRLISGDLLIITRNNYAYDTELFNGNIVQVEACTPDSEVETRNVHVKLGKGHIENIELRFRKATIRLSSDFKSESLNIMLLDNFLEDASGSIGSLLSSALIVDFNNRLEADIKAHLPEIKKSLKSNKELEGRQKEIYDSYIKLLHHDPYYNAVICKYGYAITCHKAQGGEWDNVFIDMGRYGGTANEGYFRWAYTAITRTAKKSWYYRSPDFDYISGIIVEPIQLSSNIKVSTYSTDIDFCKARFKRLKRISQEIGFSVTEDRTRPYQHWLTFTREPNESATYILWYKANGYSGKDVLHYSTSNEVSEICKSIVDSSLIPETVSFINNNRPFASKLYEFIKSQLDEMEIKLLDITQDNYHDVFHMKTDGLAKVEFYYTSKGKYTFMRPISSIGENDAKLKTFCNRFK